MLRHFAKEAGAHIYMDTGDIIWVGTNYIAVHTTSSGTKTVKFRKKCSAFEVFEKKFYGQNTDMIKFDSDKNKTLVFTLK